MYFRQLAIGGYDHNFSYIIGDEKSREIFLVDPDNREMIMELVGDKNLKVRGIILTHGHFDHVGISPELSRELEIPVYLHFADKIHLREEIPALKDLAGIESLRAGKLLVHVIHTPGHSPGAVCLYAENKLITGDTVFVGKVGRTDLKGSDPEQMAFSIEKIKALPDDTEIYPGHNYGDTKSSTVGREKLINPWF